MIFFIRFFFPAIVWAIIIFLFSSRPTGTASDVDIVDFGIKKLAHVTEYAIFTVLYYRAFFNMKLGKKRSLKYAFVFAVAYAMTDEIHQRFTPGRESAFRDVIFDTIGASIAVYVIWKYLPNLPKRLKKLAESFQLVSAEGK